MSILDEAAGPVPDEVGAIVTDETAGSFTTSDTSVIL
jgi:hypothetical protein